ncbi:hypothetical protein [Nannocystis punicea]|uniref:Uncharacterized protein n=1 Tax=Nannocystis punicea TaxID=2995304 RepID=A0ABY7H3Z2_9BACT|nr:hypothetical protein [Nannocystis poenicansa]WAS93990.1 hypothetical protein O0S08_48295 [Nannocystis poenicansa]
MGTEPVVYVFHHAAPIAVGHRVELQFFERDTGFFSVEYSEQLDMPLIRDLDTGIEYAPEWLFKREARDHLGPSSPRVLEMSPSVRPTRALTGTVVACRVVTGLVAADWTVFTYLTLHEEETRIYR